MDSAHNLRCERAYYQVLLNSGGKVEFVQRNDWGKYSVSMHQLMTGPVQSLEKYGHPKIYYSFWNPANPATPLPTGWLLCFIEADGVIDAAMNCSQLWWNELKNVESLRQSYQQPTLPRQIVESGKYSKHQEPQATKKEEDHPTLPRMRKHSAMIPTPLHSMQPMKRTIKGGYGG